MIVERDEALRGLLHQVLVDLGWCVVECATPPAPRVGPDAGLSLIVVGSSDVHAVRELSRVAPTIALTDGPTSWAGPCTGQVRLLPLVFELEDLEAAIRSCQAAAPTSRT